MNNIQFTSGWPSQILVGEVSNTSLVDNVANYILSKYDLTQPSSEINRQDLFKDPFFNEFKQEVVVPAFNMWLQQCLGKTINEIDTETFMRAWITGAHNGYNIMSHNHSGAHLSAVFYLFNDSPETGGNIVFFDPRSNANRGYKPHWSHLFEPVTLKTTTYTFAVFPSFIYHPTTPFKGNIRLAMPVDLFI